MKRRLTDEQVEEAARQAAYYLPRLWPELQEWEREKYRAEATRWFLIFQKLGVIEL